MSILKRIRKRLDREDFQPTVLAALLRPTCIIRHGLFRTIRDLAPSIEGDVLDFGCGSKPYENLFSKARSYTGVDLEVTGHDHCNSRIDRFYDGEHLPFPNSHFDAVVSFEVFEHVFNLADVLREINRVTKDLGYLLVSVPFAWAEHEVPYDFARYTTFGISDILKKAGYEVIETRKTTTFILAVFQMFIAYLAARAPRLRFLGYLRQLFIVFPLTAAAYALNAVLPRRYDYFCNTVILAQKLRGA